MVTGTLVETKQDAGKVSVEPKDLTAPGTGLGGKEKGAETKPEKTYRQSEVDALLGKAGQKLQSRLAEITTERDTLKSERDALTAEITEAKASIESLTRDIEAMSEGDENKLILVKLRKDKEKDLQSLKAERAGIADSKAEIAKWNRDQLVYTVADELVTVSGEAVDFDTFMTAADRFKLSEREELELLAETMGFKPKAETAKEPPITEEPPMTVDSGVTHGGGISTEEERLKSRYPSMFPKK